MSRNISKKALDKYRKDFHGNHAYEVAANASVQCGLDSAAIDYQKARKNSFTFSIDLKQGSITNQRASGRCWLFAALNMMRFEIIHNYELEDFELSQNYLFFWDKLEKSNYYLETMISIADEPVDGRLYSWINMGPVNDGGQWDMMVNLVRKYGVCPRDAYPDGANSKMSRYINGYLTRLLREDAVKLRKAVKEGLKDREIQDMKQQMLSEVYRCLVIALGEPPVKFDLTFKNKSGKVTQEFGITPLEFYDKYVGINLDDYVSVINAPTDDKPFDRMFTVKYLGNVAEGSIIRYLNLPMDMIKEMTIAQLSDGHPVWFGSDVGRGSHRELGLFDEETLDIAGLLDVRYEFGKGERLVYGDSAMNHAMVLQGVNLNAEGKPDRWKVENSWGKEAGLNGYYIASDSWFDNYVFQVAINKKYLPEKYLSVLKEKPIELEPWDPMGTLAD